MTRVIMAMVAGLALAGGARADDWWVGYEQINATTSYPIHDMVAGGFKVGSEDLSQGLLSFGGAVMRPVGGGLDLGVAWGFGLPLGTWTIHVMNGEIPAVGSPNRYDGDQYEIKIWTVPLLARARWGMDAGPGRVSISVSAGMLLLVRHTETIDQLWVDTGGVWDSSRWNATDTHYGQNVQSDSAVDGFPMASLAPGFALAVGEHDELGLEVPITMVIKEKISGEEQTLVNPVTTQPNPYQTVRGIEVGGLTFGGRVVWRRKF